MDAARLQTDLLVEAGRLLLRYNESTGAIHRALETTSKALTGKRCGVAVSYGGVAISVGGEAPVLMPIAELRYNTAVQTRVHEILDEVRRGVVDTSAALTRLRCVEADAVHHSRWLVAPILGAAACGLAVLLGGDAGAAVVAGIATALGLFARQAAAARHFSVLASPLIAAFIGAVAGGLAIRLGWTQAHELVLIVPALMVVPGPHLINGLLDLIDNYVPMALARLALAAGILIASTAGVVLGIELTLTDPISTGPALSPLQLNLLSDAVLAGIVTCGFAVFYNTTWRCIWLAILGGMAGHGLRFLALQLGCGLEGATFLGGFTVGAISGWIAQSRNMPVAVIGFAGAVTMIPGLHIYRALGGALKIAREYLTQPETAAAVLANVLQGLLVVSALALGVILGDRLVQALWIKRDSRAGSSDRNRVNVDYATDSRAGCAEDSSQIPARPKNEHRLLGRHP
jgi:uncharacterized membrane protein YjjP (DUF1212 family)